MKTLNEDNKDDFFDDVEVGMVFLYTIGWEEVKELADSEDYRVLRIGANRAKITDKKYAYHTPTPVFRSTSYLGSSGGYHSSGGGGFGGFGGFGGGSFGGGGAKF